MFQASFRFNILCSAPSAISHFGYERSDDDNDESGDDDDAKDASSESSNESTTAADDAATIGSSAVASNRSMPLKLSSIYSISATTALVSWTKSDDLLVDGFYVAWRGPPLTDGRTMLNVTTSRTTSAIVDGLRPFSAYDFFLVPYRGARTLQPSNSMELLTPEGTPSPPRNVFARMENLTS